MILTLLKSSFSCNYKIISQRTQAPKIVKKSTNTQNKKPETEKNGQPQKFNKKNLKYKLYFYIKYVMWKYKIGIWVSVFSAVFEVANFHCRL